jgi:hypothetical protein
VAPDRIAGFRSESKAPTRCSIRCLWAYSSIQLSDILRGLFNRPCEPCSPTMRLAGPLL